MALIKCPECGKEISDASTACIHCGYPISKNPDVQKKVKSNIENKEKKESLQEHLLKKRLNRRLKRKKLRRDVSG